MAYGSHWEWRGFGGATARFADSFSELESYYRPGSVLDRYIWFPGISVNVKIREGSENGMKFKRLKDKKGAFELWSEPEEKFFSFPLNAIGQETLIELLNNSKLNFNETNTDLASLPSNKNKIEKWLLNLGCQIIEVEKVRETKIWFSNSGSALVEWSCISKPQSLISIGLENHPENVQASSPDDSDLYILEQCKEDLKLTEEPLRIMNYMDSLKIWAEENKI